jgi:hypothetical protein
MNGTSSRKVTFPGFWGLVGSYQEFKHALEEWKNPSPFRHRGKSSRHGRDFTASKKY